MTCVLMFPLVLISVTVPRPQCDFPIAPQCQLLGINLVFMKRTRKWKKLNFWEPYNDGRRGGLMVSALDSGSSGLGSSPGQGTVLSSWERQFTLTVPLFTQVYKWDRRIYCLV